MKEESNPMWMITESQGDWFLTGGQTRTIYRTSAGILFNEIFANEDSNLEDKNNYCSKYWLFISRQLTHLIGMLLGQK